MAVIGILGAGSVAQILATAWVGAGPEIIVGARKSPPPTWIETSGCRASTLAEAALAGEIVVNALPGAASLQVIANLAPALFSKVLIDVANAVDLDEAGFAVTLSYAQSSLAEQIQAVVPEARVVKTLNTMHQSVMTAPNILSSQPTIFVSGNDKAAKESVAGLLTDLGWPEDAVIDLGEIQSARIPEAFILMVAPLVRALGPVPFAFSVAR